MCNARDGMSRGGHGSRHGRMRQADYASVKRARKNTVLYYVVPWFVSLGASKWLAAAAWPGGAKTQQKRSARRTVKSSCL
jgi:hypothetical protein